ncbi:MAG: sigma-54-dependent Fis family transcriptional regulator [Deltaproteobacteria bacterium]|nr:MAG: sigma-54-dependent Fis family transcriptional regulator [Deltaproteobacteria bacterium]
MREHSSQAALSTGALPNSRILLVEDNEDFAYGLSLSLRRQGYSYRIAASLSEAQEILSESLFDVILLDLTLPDASGTTVVSTVRQMQPEAALLVLTGRNDAELAVQTLRLGAQDYLTKPISHKELLKSIGTYCKQIQSRRSLQPSSNDNHSSNYMVGKSPAWQHTLSMLRAAAAAPKTTVLLTGEPGVGKEVGAQLIHQHSDRTDKPLVSVNMACLPDSLLEAELFGYEAGAFTGAQSTKRGLFEQAQGGTLFLDEIGEMPLELQAKLLRVLEGKPFRRLGGETLITPDVRLVSATNRNLAELVEQGLFRSDLYHRLKVLEISVPPLRERGDDVERLALHFLARLGNEMGRKQIQFSSEALRLLQSYSWPGNVRELRNVVERALVLCPDTTISPYHLPQELHPSRETHKDNVVVLPKVPVLEVVRPPAQEDEDPSEINNLEESQDLRLKVAIANHIKHVLDLCDGNVSQAAACLDITRQTLRRRLKEAESF